MTDKNDPITLISQEARQKLIETHRRSLSFSLTAKAAGDSSLKNQTEIEEARTAIVQLMQLQGGMSSEKAAGRLLRVLVESEPPGAYVTLDGQSIPDAKTPWFIDLSLDSGMHLISASLPGFSPLETDCIYCEVVANEKSGAQLRTGHSNSLLNEQRDPVVKFEFRRNRVNVRVKTNPEIPGAEISIRGIEEHNLDVVIDDARTDQSGQVEVAGSGESDRSEIYLPSGTYMVQGRWRPLFGLFAQFSSPRTQARAFPGDTSYHELQVEFHLSAPFALWRAFLQLGPVSWLHRSKPIAWLRSLPSERKRHLNRRVSLATIVLLPILVLFGDWVSSTTAPDDMVLIAGTELPAVRYDDPVSENLRTWLNDENTSVWGNVMGSIAIKPQTRVLERFAIDRYEVSVAEYQKFLKFNSERKGRTPRGVERWEEFQEVPVTGIDWYDAKAYCESIGKRLPTAVEWQTAAGGGVANADGNIAIFPWGNEFDASRCNVKESPYRGLLPTRSEELCPSEASTQTNVDRCWSPYGVCSMVGNAAEWVDEHRVKVSGQVVETQLDERRQVKRQEFSMRRYYAFMGGSFLDPGRLSGMAFARVYHDPEVSLPRLGVRCAASLSGSEIPPPDMVALGPFEEARNGPPELPYVEPIRGLGVDDTAYLLGQTLELILASRRNANLHDFLLDRQPVSEEEYQSFILSTRGHRGRWSHPRQPSEKKSHAVGTLRGAPEEPIDYVDWWDAYAYCSWRGMRLPTRAELEIAYSGGTTDSYPWGEVYEPRKLLNYQSPYGIEGLVERFTEWTGDYYYGQLVKAGEPRIVRGGILSSEMTKKLYSLSGFIGYSSAGHASSAFRCARNADTPMIETIVAFLRE